MPLEPGAQLGPYEVLAAIGAGGMGEVYRAKDTRLDRTVALKVLPQHLAADPDLRQRLEREARAVSSLNHPHICTLFDVGHQDGTDFLVMEHLEGETLADRLSRGPLPTEQVLRYGIEIADALDKAHRQGIVHPTAAGSPMAPARARSTNCMSSPIRTRARAGRSRPRAPSPAGDPTARSSSTWLWTASSWRSTSRPRPAG